jgi:hypothetical protein
MPRKLAMYEETLSDPLLRDVWTILETVSPWKTTRAMTAVELLAGELPLDAPIVSNVPAMPMPVVYGPHPRHAPAPVFSYVPALANAGGDVKFSGTGEEVEELIQIVENAR